MENKVNVFHEVIDENNPTAYEVANWFINYNGAQILTDEFFEFLKDEGNYIPGEE